MTNIWRMALDWQKTLVRLMALVWLMALLSLIASGAADAAEDLQSIEEIGELVRSELISAADEANLEQAVIDISMPDGRLRLQNCPSSALRAKVASSTRLPGRASVEVSCEAEHRWKIYVQATVATKARIPVPRWNIPRNQQISLADIEYREITMTEPINGIIDREELVIGKIASRFLTAGEPLRTSHISTPLLVERGQNVTIRYRVGHLELTAAGTAQAAGHQGDWIRVRNTNSGTLVEGRVNADGSVLVASEN